MSVSMTEETNLKGELLRVLFSNESGFCIGSFKDDERTIFTGKGLLINPQIGLQYKLMGKWEKSPKYGKQFSFSLFETETPNDPDGIFKYLVRVCKYVGPAIGQALIDKYNADTLTIIKKFPSKVASDIPGLTLSRTEEIRNKLIENEKSEKIMIALHGMLNIEGMLKSLPEKVYAQYKSNAPDKIRQNPYILTDFPRVGFNLADRVALNIGFSRTSIERKKAAAIHCLREYIQTGSVWILKSDLLVEINTLIQLTNLEEGVQSLINDGIIILENDYIAFKTLAMDERKIAAKAIMLFTTPLPEDKIINDETKVAA